MWEQGAWLLAQDMLGFQWLETKDQSPKAQQVAGAVDFWTRANLQRRRLPARESAVRQGTALTSPNHLAGARAWRAWAGWIWKLEAGSSVVKQTQRHCRFSTCLNLPVGPGKTVHIWGADGLGMIANSVCRWIVRPAVPTLDLDWPPPISLTGHAQHAGSSAKYASPALTDPAASQLVRVLGASGVQAGAERPGRIRLITTCAVLHHLSLTLILVISVSGQLQRWA